MALSSGIAWEVRTAGNSTNGGGYHQQSSGIDYTQQDAAQLALTDCATSGVGSTTLTSVTGGFTADMIGNLINLSSGTNLTTGFYEITAFTDANTITIDRAPDDGVGGVSGATGKVGGALDWPPGQSDSTVNGKVWIKEGTYTLTSSVQGDLYGPVRSANGVSHEGYSVVRGDLGSRPVFSSGSLTGLSVPIFYGSGDGGNSVSVVNINIDGVSESNGNNGLNIWRGALHIERCKVINCNQGIYTEYGTVKNCEVYDCTNGITSSHTEGCIAGNISNVGFNAYGQSSYSYCVAYNCRYGYYSAYYGKVLRCIADSCTDFGLYLYGSYFMTDGLIITNCQTAIYARGGRGHSERIFLYNNTSDVVYYGTADDYNNRWLDYDTTSITSDPYTDRANADYTLNNNPGGGKVYRDILNQTSKYIETFYPPRLPEKQDTYARDYQPLPLFEFSVGTDSSRDYSSLTACFAALNNTLVDKANSKVIITVYNDTGTDKWYCDTSTVTLNIPSNCIDFVLTVDDDSWHKGQYDKGCIIQLQSSSTTGCFNLATGNDNRILIERLAFDANNQIGSNTFLPSVFLSSNSSVNPGHVPIPPNSLKNLYIRGGDGTTVDNVRGLRGINTTARHFLVDSCIVENLVCSGSSSSQSGMGIAVYYRSQVRNCTVNNVDYQNGTGTNYGIYGATNYGNTENCIVTNIGAGAGSSECYLSSMINLSSCVADDTTGTIQSTASTEFVDHANSDYRLKPGATSVGLGSTTKAQIEDITGNRRRSAVAHDAGAFNNISGYDYDYDVAVPTADPTGLTTVFPFRYLVEDDFDDGTGPVAHPLRGN